MAFAIHRRAQWYGEANTIRCPDCDLQWDKHEPEPAECKQVIHTGIKWVAGKISGLMIDTNRTEPLFTSASGQHVYIGCDVGGGDCEAATVYDRHTKEILAQEVSKPGGYLTDEQWAALRRACGEKA